MLATVGKVAVKGVVTGLSIYSSGYVVGATYAVGGKIVNGVARKTICKSKKHKTRR